MADKNVLPRVSLLTESVLKQLVSSALSRLRHRHDLTQKQLAERLFVDPGTIANAENRDNKLQPQTLFNLLTVDPLALESLLAHFGRRSVPIEAKCDTDALVSTSGAVHQLAAVQSPASPGGARITDHEALEIEPFLDAATEAMAAIKVRCEAIRAGRQAA